MKPFFNGGAADAMGLGSLIAPFTGPHTSDFEVYDQYVDPGMH
jgi:hypothetical protein